MKIRSVIVGQFQHPSGFFGQMAGWIMAHRPSNRERNQWTVDLLEIHPQDKVLEIGCGPGLALSACLVKVREGFVVGFDHSQTMLAQARARNARAILEGRLDLRLGTVEELPPTNEKFNKIFSVNVVQFIHDKVAAFQALFARLAPRGLMAITYMPRNQNPTRANALQMASEVKRHMKKVDFVNIRVEELSLKPVPAVCVIGEHP